MSECIFCKILDGRLPAKPVFENAHFICIPDLHPQATVHLLLISKQHFSDFAHGDEATLNALLPTAAEVAKQKGLLPHGFRTIINTGSGGGQTVFHFHAHLLADEALGGTFV